MISAYLCHATASVFSPVGAFADVLESPALVDFVVALASWVENSDALAPLARLALLADAWVLTGLMVDGSTFIDTLVGWRCATGGQELARTAR